MNNASFLSRTNRAPAVPDRLPQKPLLIRSIPQTPQVGCCHRWPAPACAPGRVSGAQAGREEKERAGLYSVFRNGPSPGNSVGVTSDNEPIKTGSAFLFLFEIVRVQPSDGEDFAFSDPDAVVNHQLSKAFAVNQNNALSDAVNMI